MRLPISSRALAILNIKASDKRGTCRIKKYFRLLVRAFPFTFGIALSLVSLCYLVRFYDYGLDFEDEYLWMFAVFFGLGFPALIYGMNRLSNESL